MKFLREARQVLKIILLILIVAAVICGTTFLFFHFLKREDSFTFNSEHDDFVAQIEKVQAKQQDKNRGKFEVILNVNSTLNDITTNMMPFLKTTKVNNKNLSKKYDAVTSSTAKCEKVISTYLKRTTDESFNKDVEVNGVFENLNNYLTVYADFVGYTSLQIVNNLKNGDVEIALYLNQVYADVVVETLKNYTLVDEIYDYIDLANLNKFENFIKADGFKNYYINTDIISNKFIDSYKKIDHSAFAKNLSELLDNPSEDEMGSAAKILKQLLSVGG